MRGRKFSKTDLIGFILILLFSLWGISLLVGVSGDRGGRTIQDMDPDELVHRAQMLESEGNIQEALVLYKEAINRKPSLCDPKSTEFLGKDFEEKINGWIRQLKMGDMDNRERALENAAYIFRKLNGGCG